MTQETWKAWIKGLIGAFITAGATAASGVIVSGLKDEKQLAAEAIIAGIAGIILYLKKSPLP